MGRLIFDFLYSKGIYDSGIENILTCTESDLADIVIGLLEVIDENSNRGGLGVKFLANRELSGLPFPCSDLDCRLKNVNQLI